ncbi:MAG TPA: response regulator [Xenococcaceae cyanobacterium]
MVSDFCSHESYKFFLQEIPDLLTALENGILHLQKDSDVTDIWELMRIAHSIKGASACVGLNYIQEIAHYLEASLKLIRENQVKITAKVEEFLLQSFDCLNASIFKEINSELTDSSQLLEDARQTWTQLKEHLNLNSPASESSQSSEQNLTQLLFQEEVSSSLHSIELVLKSHNQPRIFVELNIQTQILRGIGEICNVKALVEIADIVLEILQRNPETACEVGQQALLDFRSAQELVLEEATHLPDLPSQALLELDQQIKNQTISLPPEQPQPTDLVAPKDLNFSQDEVQNSSNVEDTPPNYQPKPNIILTKPPDWERLKNLNTLMSELVFLDNKFLVLNQNHEAILEIFANSSNRIKLNLSNLKTWINQNSKNSKSSYFKSIDFVKFTLEETIEELFQLNENFNDLNLLGQQYQQIQKHQKKYIKSVKENLLKTQMVSIGSLFNQFNRVIRDLSVQTNKQVNLKITGDKTLIEQAVLEKLYNPLIHLIRNAFVHGIEEQNVREFYHKPLTGTIYLKAWNQGHYTYVEVEDDGKGINLNQIKHKALEKGYLSQETLPFISEQQLYQYLFEPDFSTHEKLDQLAGRGVGLYAVQTEISQLKGTISIKSQAGIGTSFTLRLPMSSTISKLVIFRVSGHQYALQVNSLAAIVLSEAQNIYQRSNNIFYSWGNQFVPIFALTTIGSYNYPFATLTQQELGSNFSLADSLDLARLKNAKCPLLLISQGAQCIALLADEILFERDLVIKPFTHLPFSPPSHLCGCTILGDGQLVPVLDSQFLLDHFGQITYIPSDLAFEPHFSQTTTLPKTPVIMVVDDSLTIRNSLANTLSKAQYRILQAKDGWEAFQLWQQNTSIDAVICDIEMPRMNGLELLSRCRQYDQNLPFIILTYRNNQKYRQLAQQLGATAYLAKPYLDQELIDTLQNCFKP